MTSLIGAVAAPVSGKISWLRGRKKTLHQI